MRKPQSVLAALIALLLAVLGSTALAQSSPCSGHGSLNPDGSCTCNPQYGGTACQACATNFYGPLCQFCDASTTCGGHGTCSTATGFCQCAPGYTGASCSAQGQTCLPAYCPGT